MKLAQRLVKNMCCLSLGVNSSIRCTDQAVSCGSTAKDLESDFILHFSVYRWLKCYSQVVSNDKLINKRVVLLSGLHSIMAAPVDWERAKPLCAIVTIFETIDKSRNERYLYRFNA